MQVEEIKSLFLKHKETNLSHRYITNKHIEPLLNNLKEYIAMETIGKSVLNKPIYGFKVGEGKKRILMWSQMHGNESTTTKALFDLLNTLLVSDTSCKNILEACTLYIIPILNPDGAEAYMRINANKVDLNRDAQNLSQPESKILRATFESFKPHFCFNLHGQRTIFSTGNTNKSATVSFLAPAQDEACTITPNRKVAMEVISIMNNALQKVIPNQVGVYDDAFNLNCVGDTFQNENIPTILFEAGHYKDDYGREVTRELIYISYISSLNYIANNAVKGDDYKPYLEIPENEKCFFDVIIRNAKVSGHSNEKINDIAIQYQEKLIDNKIEFIPKIEKIENLDAFYGHKEINANGFEVLNIDNQLVEINYENVFVIINNEKIALISK
ncbi:M14 metallopeptidase family protein [Flavivirga abyssicola]|uniref:M14 family metallopeptidase n=1 Tax=Flavivirga abyssicola TaxID=3063533 RepID=UPI0026DFCE55|nr:M14 metallopeptidase family protein [Flavivirga sp. MEBiC07777]WVK13021.1 M14 metallopeptidase family protein [Flavivirga sp. MEBiC07777]